METKRSGIDEEMIDYALNEQKPINLDGVKWLKVGIISGRLISPTGAQEYRYGLGKIIWYGVVYVFRDEQGDLLCASSDKLTADAGRIGKSCDSCEDWLKGCKMHYRIVWADVVSKQLFAMTLSRTSTVQFSKYLKMLKQNNLDIYQILTRISLERAIRQTKPFTYLRLRFDHFQTNRSFEWLD